MPPCGSKFEYVFLAEGVMEKRVLTALAVLTGMFLLSTSIVWAQAAPVEKTGQTTSYVAGDDGDLQKGIASPSPRFIDNSDGTVTDNLTGLMWAKDANLNNAPMTWTKAIDNANNLSLGSYGCSASYTDWRLPNIKELQSLIDFSNYNLTLPSGHPFSNVQSSYYLSSTTYAYNTDYAWGVGVDDGSVYHGNKAFSGYVWPVRSDN
jgi:hypothetical protein